MNQVAPTPPPAHADVDPQFAPPAGVPCPNCGCPVEKTDRFCAACGAPNAAAAIPVPPVGPATTKTDDEVVDAHVVPPSTPVAGKHFRCEQCGAEVRVDPEQRSYTCPFCDSNYVVEFTSEENRHSPEFVIGFAITPERARELYRTWITQNAWFNPGDLSVAAVEDKQRGVYLPFWSFPMHAESSWSASIGENWTRTETYTDWENGKPVTKTRTVTETEWYPLRGRHHRYYSGYMVSGSKGLTQQDAMRVMPFQIPALKRYEPYYIAGWICEEYSIDQEQALELCREEFQRQEEQNIRAFLPGDTASQLVVSTQFSHVSSDLCLLPMYILSYRYQGKLYRFLVNGQTGKYAGDKPLSWQRIGIAIGVGLFLLFMLIVVILVLSSR